MRSISPMQVFLDFGIERIIIASGRLIPSAFIVLTLVKVFCNYSKC